MHADLGEVKLQGVVGGQGDHEASGQILWQRVPVVAEEQAVIAERRHGNADLCQVVEILQHRSLWGGGQSRQCCISAAALTTHIHTHSPVFLELYVASSRGECCRYSGHTFLRSSPWEMFSDSMKPDTRWWMGPASPQ